MENTKITNSNILKNDDSNCNSMYFSFNASSLDEKTLERDDITIDNSEDFNDVNDTFTPVLSTIKKANNNPSINVLINTNVHSSTPTKYFSPVSIPIRKDKSLGIAVLQMKDLSENENKENHNAINDMNLQIEQLDINKGSNNTKNKHLLDVPKKNLYSNLKQKLNGQLYDALKNRPSRILDKKLPVTKPKENPIHFETNKLNNIEEKNDIKDKDTISKILSNSKEALTFQIEKRRTLYAAYTFPNKSTTEGNNAIKRQPRYSITKTTLNSPGIINKNMRKTIFKNDIRKSISQTKLFMNSSKNLHLPTIDNRNLESSSTSAVSLTSNFKQKLAKRNIQQSSEANNKTIKNMCKYCDKCFAIPKALQTHLLENCLKIPPNIRKKLLLNEYKYISTVKLPIQTNVSKAISNLTASTVNSNDSVNSIDGAKKELDDMPPPPSTKVKKKTAHSGIYRTPTKVLKCQICSEKFINVFEYTTHTLSHTEAN